MLTQKYRDFLEYQIYQIYPRSFCDANGDGIGDLKGIISKLDYLKELGVNAVWLCPCYKSPNEDNGYDIADYRDIMDEFGTMDDIKELIAGLHERGIKVIMDLVPNHTSTQHKWFQESRKSKDNPYSDFYYWFDTPPNDWQSEFGGTAYQYDELRGQYYLHSYAIGQADLNWENPRVVEEMQAVVDFWVDLGADGFRIDVVDQISKDWEGDRNCFGPRLHEFIHALFGREKTKHVFTVGECWCDDIDEVRRHCAADRGELVTLFQFHHIGAGRENKWTPKTPSMQDYWKRLLVWEEKMQENDLIYSLFTDNHDQAWMLSRTGNTKELKYESATCIATMTYLLQGVPFIYQGQEFGMTSPKYDTIDDFRDVESLNFYKIMCDEMSPEDALAGINFGSRDNTRRPMCWNGGVNGGFSSADKEIETWAPLHSDYKTLNLEADKKAEKSVFRFYQALLKLRTNTQALKTGRFELVSDADANYCAFTRAEGDEKFLIICNFEEEQEICIEGAKGEALLSNYGYSEKTDTIYKPYEIAVFKM